MPRRNRARGDSGSPRPLVGGALGWSRTEVGPDGEWTVRSVPGARGRKTYRCPGCDHEIAPGVGHVVAWPAGAGATGSSDDRRHWHTACWASRRHRRPGRRT
ncbi:hypothetical protein [Pseudonocardia acaciae]|uniref:hypothetical protein n=1 Tax=Pseudonocardia acaciae TaxID=551276 RepID=UPI000491A77C|nr:hypothetical protein [Pseudonocardia acaciae]